MKTTYLNQPIDNLLFPIQALRIPRLGRIRRDLKTGSEPVLSLPESWISPLIKQYDLRVLEPITRLRGGKRNENWFLKTSDGPKVLKRYMPAIPYTQVRYEHALLTHLEQKNFPTVRLMRDVQGETIFQQDGRIYALFNYLEGYFRFDEYLYLPPLSGWFLTHLGLALSLLHHALSDFEPPEYSQYGFLSKNQERLLNSDWYVKQLEKNRSTVKTMVSWRGQMLHHRLVKMAGWLEDNFLKIEAQLSSLRPERQVIHGDYGRHNVLIRPNAPMVVLDFELSRLDWRLVDLIAAFSTTTASYYHTYDLRKIQQILSGYQSGQPITREPLIWKYRLLDRIIRVWAKYLEREEPQTASDILNRLAQYQWVQRNQEQLTRLTLK
jgi:Ser/Thr protein kinase RdoA (MazF antagonist)